MENPEEYRKYAKECERLAIKLPQHAARLQKIAEAWEDCAKHVERKSDGCAKHVERKSDGKADGNGDGSSSQAASPRTRSSGSI
jgi:hypothetical protein